MECGLHRDRHCGCRAHGTVGVKHVVGPHGEHDGYRELRTLLRCWLVAVVAQRITSYWYWYVQLYVPVPVFHISVPMFTGFFLS